QQMTELAHVAVGISEERYNVGQADRPDVLAAEVELQRAELDLLRARNEWAPLWQLPAAIVNEPALQASTQPMRLAGALDGEAPQLKQDELLATLLRDSPEIKAAQAGVVRAQAVLARAKAEPSPDI